MASDRSSDQGGAAPPSSNPLPPDWQKDLTQQFRQKLSTKRMNELSSRPGSLRSRSPRPQSRDPSAPPPTYTNTLPPRHGSGNLLQRSPSSLDDFSLGNPAPTSSLRNIPLIPSPPSDGPSRQFRNQLHMLSETPRKWENPGLLDDAMKAIPLDRIYRKAGEECEFFQASAASQAKKPAWAYQDCVIRELMKWFKGSFFSWVNNPSCSRCRAVTIAQGMCAPTAEEHALGGNRVELYRCSQPSCGSYERFPRYNDAFVLVQTQRGRCGEWANCFGMLCRAMGARVRWIWNSEDHVWIEVFSEYRRRWVHVDPCEAQFDKPLTYTQGWGKKMAYCIAFSADGAMDVTRRYCRNPMKMGLERNKCQEAVLLHILEEIRHMRRSSLPKDEKFRLEGEDAREMRELRHHYVKEITNELSDIATSNFKQTQRRRMSPSEEADAQKARESREQYPARQTGDADWVASRGEDGGGNDQNHNAENPQPRR